MPIYEVEAPDGKILEIEGPEGASQESILAYAKNIAYPQYLKQQQESEKEAFPALRAAADVPVSFARGATTGVRMISDFFGADNPVSQNLISVESYLESLMSAQSRKDSQEISRIMKDAEDKGVLEQVKAGIKAFTVAPVDILTNAFGTAAPTIAAGLAASTLAPAAAVGTGALTAGRVAAGAVGAVSGAGTIKGTIYNDVKQALLEQNVPEDVAEETAVRAQSYNGENLDSILAGGAIGTIASITGLEPAATKNVLARLITSSAAKEATETTAAKTGAGAIARGAVAEAAPEAAQAGQEQLASNIALQREGQEVPTMRGVAGAAALEGVVGGILGGAARGLEGRPEETAKTDEDAALKEALDVFNQNQKSKGLGPILQIEDMTGNRLLAFANENREKIPVLGQILDSGIPRDIKIEQIKKRLADLPQYAAPTQTAVEGRVALPAPPEPGTLTSAAEAFSTAMKSNVPMTDLRVQQGPEGYRVVNESGQVITQQVKTEREANVLMEALRRENDARNTGIYQQDVKAYEQERLPVVTEAVARAAREVQTPITGYPMKDVKAVDEGLFNAIREARKGRRLTADATPEEIAKLNPSQAVMNELNIIQKPVTGGGAAIRPEYETEILGPRPTAPLATARSAEQLKQSTEKVPGKIGRKKVMFAPSLVGAEVTQTQPLSQFELPKMVTLYRSSGMMDPGPGVERWTTDKETARRFGPIREVSIPQDMVERFSRPYEGGGRQELLFDKGGRTPMQIAKQMPVSQQGLEQEYSAVPEQETQTVSVMHGTPVKGLNKLNPRAAREVLGSIWFTDNPDVANQYTFEREYGEMVGEEQGRIINATLRFKNPYIVDMKGDFGEATRLSKLLDYAKKNGHDALVLENVDDSVDGSKLLGTSYAIWNPDQIDIQEDLEQQDVEEYSAAGKKPPAKKKASPKKKREIIANILAAQKGEAAPAGFRPAEGKQPRQERGTYTLPPETTTTAPTAEAVAEAEKVINARIERVARQGEQGKKIAEGLRTALESGEFTPEQMVIAFQMSDISARLLGTTAAAPHDFKFFNGIFKSSSGTRVFGLRSFTEGSVQLATISDAITKGRNTAAHEAFHVLQDLFNEYDKPAARIIRDAFRGAVTVDNISPDLLRKLKSIRDPESGKTYDQLVKDNIGDLYKNAPPQKRERELQAYVFAALEDARSKGVSVQSFGGAFTRLLNFISDFKMRLRNYLDGRGYRTAADLFEQIGKGEAQRGLGVDTERSGAKVIQRGRFEPEDLTGRPQAISEDISEAAVEDINATGQGPAVEANSNTYTKTWDYVREFFNPFALVTNQPLLFQFRNKMYGSISMSEGKAKKVSNALAKANAADREATYKYLTTRNADPTTIVDPNVRAAAQEAKTAINKIGQELVDNKFMTQESYDTFYDQYLPRIYLYHQMTGRGMTTPLGGVSKMEYVMKRKDLSKEERDLLGEIKDPAFLAYVAMARPARDLAMSEYLTNLASFSDLGGKGSPWVLPQSVFKWNGKNTTAYALLAEASDIRQFVLPVAEQHDPEQARIILANLNKMEEVGNRKMAELRVIEENKSFDTTKYEQMPKDKRYGLLAGAIIQKGIYNDLVGTFIPFQVENRPLLMRMMGDENSLLSRATGLWKLGKTTLNIPTQFRNFVSNMIALTLFTDISIVRLPGLFRRALVEITKDSQNWKDAQEFGITGGTMSSAELRGIYERTLQRINKYDDNKNENPLIKAYAMARIAASTVVEKAGDAYQNAEVLFKFMAFLNERQKQGFVRKPELISNAVNVANDSLFDYTLVNPNIRWVRNAPIGLPFITYFYKVAPKLIETAYKHPMRFAPYIALATALPLYTMAELDLTPEELESMRKTLPEFIRDKGSLYFLPYRDEKGNIMYVDLAPFFPWSSLIDPFYKMYKGDVVGGLGAAADPIQPGGPVVAAIAVAATGVDPFTRKPVMDPRDTPTAQAMSMVSYIWNQAMPPMFSVNLNDMDQSSGAIPRVYNSLFVDGTGVDKRGLPKPDAVNTAARLLGFNATPLMADLQRASNMNYMLSQIRKRESYRSEIAKNQAMTTEKRRAKIAEINEQIKEDYKKLQEYGTATAAAPGVAQRIRKQTEEE